MFVNYLYIICYVAYFLQLLDKETLEDVVIESSFSCSEGSQSVFSSLTLSCCDDLIKPEVTLSCQEDDEPILNNYRLSREGDQIPSETNVSSPAS